MKILAVIITFAIIVLVGYQILASNRTNDKIKISIMKITSTAFSHEGKISSKYTCDGENINPAFEIENVPREAKSLVLISDDPDAPNGTWVHWIVFNLSPDLKKIEEGIEPVGVRGATSFGRLGYGGPCPPFGTHRYFFRLYALNNKLNLEEGARREDLEKAMNGMIIEKTELMATYERQ